MHVPTSCAINFYNQFLQTITTQMWWHVGNWRAKQTNSAHDFGWSTENSDELTDEATKQAKEAMVVFGSPEIPFAIHRSSFRHFRHGHFSRNFGSYCSVLIEGNYWPVESSQKWPKMGKDDSSGLAVVSWEFSLKLSSEKLVCSQKSVDDSDFTSNRRLFKNQLNKHSTRTRFMRMFLDNWKSVKTRT